MKTILAFVVAAACCALLISSANAGGHRQGLMSSSATSTSSFPNGRSPLGEPVFLIPSSSSNSSVGATSGGPIGGYVPPRTPLPPLFAPKASTASFVASSPTFSSAKLSGGAVANQQVRTSASAVPAVASSGDGGHVLVSSAGKGPGVTEMPSASGQSTRVIFTPPPTNIGALPSVTGTGNIAGNLSADHPFGGSILNTGLGNGTTSSTVPGSGAQDPTNPTPWVRITPLLYSSPTVQMPPSAVSKAASPTNP